MQRVSAFSAWTYGVNFVALHTTVGVVLSQDVHQLCFPSVPCSTTQLPSAVVHIDRIVITKLITKL